MARRYFSELSLMTRKVAPTDSRCPLIARERMPVELCRRGTPPLALVAACAERYEDERIPPHGCASPRAVVPMTIQGTLREDHAPRGVAGSRRLCASSPCWIATAAATPLLPPSNDKVGEGPSSSPPAP